MTDKRTRHSSLVSRHWLLIAHWSLVIAVVGLGVVGCPTGGSSPTPTGAIDYSTFTNNLTTSSTTGALTGTVETPDGGPVAGARVTIGQSPTARQATASDFTVLTNDQGVFQIGNIPGGIYQVVVRHETILLYTTEVTITAGVIRAQAFQVQPAS